MRELDNTNRAALPIGVRKKETTPEKEMEAFDQLPPNLRYMLQNTRIDLSSEDTLRAHKRLEDEGDWLLMVFLNEFDRKAAGENPELFRPQEEAAAA